MKKRIMPLLAFVMGSTFVLSAMGDLVDTVLQFQTMGDDCYEDGSMLEEGECYALVWRQTDLANTISGLFDDKGVPVNSEKCQILHVFNSAAHDEFEGHVYAYATNSWCFLPAGHYSEHSTNGVYSVFLFDTRTWDGQKFVLGGKTSDTTVAALRRYGLVTDLEDLVLGAGANIKETGKGTFFPWADIKDLTFINDPEKTSTGDYSDFLSTADTPVVCRVSFYVDDETLSESRTIQIDQPIGELPTPAAREGYLFAGWFTTGGEPVTPQTIVTSGMKLMAKWDAVREPVFSSVSIANGKAVLSVTNTMPSLQYDISWVTSVVEVFSKTNWVNDVKKGEEEALSPLTWTIDLLGEPQGFFRVLRK